MAWKPTSEQICTCDRYAEEIGLQWWTTGATNKFSFGIDAGRLHDRKPIVILSLLPNGLASDRPHLSAFAGRIVAPPPQIQDLSR